MKGLQAYSGDDLVILSAHGLANKLVFKNKAINVIGLVKDKDDQNIDTAVSVVSQHIIKEVKSVDFDKSKYETEPTSDTLMLKTK